MNPRPFGTILIATVFCAAGIAALAAFWGAIPRTSGTSPLASLFALVCACAYIATAILTWRGSRFAPFVFLAAIGLLLFPARYAVPDGSIFLSAGVVLGIAGLVGCVYLRNAQHAAH